MKASENDHEPWRAAFANADADVDIERVHAVLEQRLLGTSREVRIGRYLVRGRLGEGAMGVVYAALDDRLDRMVAVKVMRAELDAPELRARLVREGRAMAQLSHPNVAAVYEIGVDRGRSFVAMELVTGCTLREWQQQAPRSWGEVVSCYVQAGRGLAAAHAAGLVHRDFKPDNVLVGDDGRVRVVDFGLARERHALSRMERTDESPVSSGSALALALTRSGTRVGTPMYMAPEQLRGESAGPAADQFAFCVALYEALHGERPFVGDSVESLLESISQGRVDRSRRHPDVPGRRFAAILRGLSADAAARWPTVDALVDELDIQHDRKRRRGAVSAAAIAILSVGFAGYVGLPGSSEPRATCSDAALRLRGAWDRDRANEVREVLVTSPADFVVESHPRIESALDAYADDWMRTRTQACEATPADGERSGRGFDATMECLDDGRDRLRALVDRLQTGNPQFVARAIEAIDELPGPSRCLDGDELGARAKPQWGTPNAAIDELYSRLADIDMALYAGEYQESERMSRAALEAARAIAHEPLQAEALLRLGDAERLQYLLPEATESLLAAARGAEACKQDRLVATAWLAVGGAVHFADEHGWLGHATSAVERLGSPSELRLELSIARAKHWGKAQDFQRSIDEFEDSLRLAEEIHGHDSRETVTISFGLALVHVWSGDFQSALPLLEDGVAAAESAFGPWHPEVARLSNLLGEVVDTVGRHREALDRYQRALAIFEEVFGRHHAFVAMVLNNISIAHRELGDGDAAVEAAERAVKADPSTRSVPTLADAYFAAGRLDDALREYDALIAASDGQDVTSSQKAAAGFVVSALTQAAAIHLLSDRLDEAETNLERADELATDPLKRLRVSMRVADLAGARGQSQLQLQRLRSALPLLDAAQPEPRDVSGLHMRIAVALIENGESRGEALEHARRARQALEGVDTRPHELAEIDAFLAKHEAGASDSPRTHR